LNFIGCDGCHTDGCTDRLEFTIVQHLNAPTAPGKYEVLIQPQGLDPVEMICNVTTEGGACYDPHGIDGDTVYDPTGGTSGICQLSVRIVGSPRTVNVEVWSDELLLGERVFAPIYELNRPNGTSCPPTCRHAEVTMRVDAPPQDEPPPEE
jgi:hypothetical protein